MNNHRNLTVLSEDKYQILTSLIDRAPAGDFAELGVYKGGVAFYMATKCNHLVHLYDTFTGIPEVESSIDNHKVGDFSDTTLAAVQELLKDFFHVVYHVGIFPDTIDANDDRSFAFVHLDGDTYSSAKEGLNYFFPRLVRGGIIVLDDYNWHMCPGIAKAVDEFNSKYNQNGYKGYSINNQYIVEKL